MFKYYCRTRQTALRIAAYALDWRAPTVIHGPHSLRRLSGLIALTGARRVLIITDTGLEKLGLLAPLLAGLDREAITYAVYDRILPNPTADHVEEALSLYLRGRCEAVVALGGGSPMDCAKAVCARVARPEKNTAQMRGLLKVGRRTPDLFAVPTTAGTGSEATIAAVISDPQRREKFVVNDTALIPRYAILDPVLTVSLPPAITATTGMDALTHAVEAYIGRANTKATWQHSRQAVALIFENLEKAFRDGADLTARDHMLMASHDAGLAFTRAYVGYAHAMAHALGGFYGTPHGLANAVVLPHVLAAYGETIHGSLAELAELTGLCQPGDSNAAKAGRFVETVRTMNRAMAIPDTLADIRMVDIPRLADRAFREANPLYPVPKILTRGELMDLFYQISTGGT